MNNRIHDQNKPFSLIENEDLKTLPKESQNRDSREALEQIVRALARQAAEADFKAEHKLH